MPLTSGTHYNTKEEIRFIDTIGSWADRHRDTPRLKLLTRYRAALLQRAVWDGLDRDVIMAHIDSEIASLMGRV